MSSRRPLLTPLRISVVLHAGLLALLVHLLPAPTAVEPREPAIFRFVEDTDAEIEATELATLEPQPEPVDSFALPDFDVLLPPVEVEDELPPIDARTAAREPTIQLHRVPQGATRKPAPAPVAKPRVAQPRVAPTARPTKAPRAARKPVPRVIRRPGTFRGFYPRDAQRQGIEGRAFVLVQVDARGQVMRARIHTSSGHPSLDRAALRVARLYEFAPGIPGRALLPVPFRLRDE